jgi:hypothetical protein
VADAPTGVKVSRDRDLRGRAHEVWGRRALLVLLAAVPVLGLLNVFGQHVGTSTASSPAATLEVQSPTRIRGGLLYQTRVRIVARERIANARLVFDGDWLEGMTLNTIEPSPRSESSADGALALDLGPIRSGRSWTQFLEFQVNPTTVGGRAGSVALYDGPMKLASVDRSATVFP